MKRAGIDPSYAKYVAATIEPVIDADTVKSFRTGKSATADSREVIKVGIDKIEASLRNVASPLARFAGDENSARTAIEATSGVAVSNVGMAKCDVTRLKNAIQRLLTPALMEVADAATAVSVKATLAGFIAGLEQSIANAADTARDAHDSADHIVEAYFSEAPQQAKAIHAEAAARVALGVKELNHAIDSLAILKRALV